MMLASRRSARSVRSSPGPRTPGEVPDQSEVVLATLRELGLRPSRRWGQSFLTDPFVADAEVALVGPCRTVVEIGGGLGILTSALLRRGLDRLTVVERDPRLAAFLRKRFGDGIRLIVGDALRIPVESAECYVGNLPYSIATPLLLRWMKARVPRIVFMVQREVAERLAAAPGSRAYGRLSIIAQLYGRLELFRTVDPEAFVPRPRVESRIAVFEGRSDSLPVPSIPDFERIVRALFSSRRKQLGNLLARVAFTSRTAEDLASRAGWPETWRHLRPEDLPPTAYFALARAVGEGSE